MANSDDPTKIKPAVDFEAQTPTQGNASGQAQSAGVAAITSRSKRESLLRKSSLGLRAAALLFSLVAFIVIASNKHGAGWNFDEVDEYRYLLAITIIATVYTGAQVVRQVIEFCTGKELFTSNWLDFLGDQILAYLLISSATGALSITNTIKQLLESNTFTSTSTASSSMALVAFIFLALSAALSGFNLSKQTYI